MKRLIPLLVLAMVTVGCTSTSTRLAIRSYEDSQQRQELVFNNTYRVAQEQMTLNLSQYIRANQTDVEKITTAVKATTAARGQLEEGRVQFERSSALSRLTVGQYLYDQQGPLNVIIENLGFNLGKSAGAGESGKTAAGSGLKDFIPKVDSTTRTTGAKPNPK